MNCRRLLLVLLTTTTCAGTANLHSEASFAHCNLGSLHGFRRCANEAQDTTESWCQTIDHIPSNQGVLDNHTFWEPTIEQDKGFHSKYFMDLSTEESQERLKDFIRNPDGAKYASSLLRHFDLAVVCIILAALSLCTYLAVLVVLSLTRALLCSRWNESRPTSIWVSGSYVGFLLFSGIIVWGLQLGYTNTAVPAMRQESCFAAKAFYGTTYLHQHNLSKNSEAKGNLSDVDRGPAFTGLLAAAELFKGMEPLIDAQNKFVADFNLSILLREALEDLWTPILATDRQLYEQKYQINEHNVSLGHRLVAAVVLLGHGGRPVLEEYKEVLEQIDFMASHTNVPKDEMSKHIKVVDDLRKSGSESTDQLVAHLKGSVDVVYLLGLLSPTRWSSVLIACSVLPGISLLIGSLLFLTYIGKGDARNDERNAGIPRLVWSFCSAFYFLSFAIMMFVFLAVYYVAARFASDVCNVIQHDILTEGNITWLAPSLPAAVGPTCLAAGGSGQLITALGLDINASALEELPLPALNVSFTGSITPSKKTAVVMGQPVAMILPFFPEKSAVTPEDVKITWTSMDSEDHIVNCTAAPIYCAALRDVIETQSLQGVPDTGDSITVYGYETLLKTLNDMQTTGNLHLCIPELTCGTLAMDVPINNDTVSLIRDTDFLPEVRSKLLTTITTELGRTSQMKAIIQSVPAPLLPDFAKGIHLAYMKGLIGGRTTRLPRVVPDFSLGTKGWKDLCAPGATCPLFWATPPQNHDVTSGFRLTTMFRWKEELREGLAAAIDDDVSKLGHRLMRLLQTYTNFNRLSSSIKMIEQEVSCQGLRQPLKSVVDYGCGSALLATTNLSVVSLVVAVLHLMAFGAVYWWWYDRVRRCTRPPSPSSLAALQSGQNSILNMDPLAPPRAQVSAQNNVDPLAPPRAQVSAQNNDQ